MWLILGVHVRPLVQRVSKPSQPPGRGNPVVKKVREKLESSLAADVEDACCFKSVHHACMHGFKEEALSSYLVGGKLTTGLQGTRTPEM